MKIFIYILLGTLLIVSCKEKAKKDTHGTEQKTLNPSQNSNSALLEKEDFSFKLEYYEAKDITSMIAKYKGERRETYELSGKMNKSFYADINNDKNQELYIATKNKKGRVTLNGYSLNAGNPIPIHISEIPGIGKTNFKSFTKSGNQIIESFQALAPDKSIVKKELRYNLVSGEAGLSLEPQGYTTNQLKSIEGIYASNDGDKSKNYKTLRVQQNEFGEWEVEIKVRKKNTTKTICDFKSVGNFYDRDLYVPLGFENPELTATLKISFVEYVASVYTQKTENAKQMATICNNTASLAGNFKKQ